MDQRLNKYYYHPVLLIFQSHFNDASTVQSTIQSDICMSTSITNSGDGVIKVFYVNLHKS